MNPVQVYTEATLPELCRQLAATDHRVQSILDTYGPPPFWHRAPGFACLLRIILEQQVSLASAWATYTKLEQRLGTITPRRVLTLPDTELKTCGFSRQKTLYARELATALTTGALDLDALSTAPDDEVRAELIRIKGIGEWTVNIYLLLSLHRLDIFPPGDLALVKSMKANGFIDPALTKEPLKSAVLATTSQFAPSRTIFALLLWHSYIQANNIVFP